MSSTMFNEVIEMDLTYLHKAVIGAAGMATGAALVTLIRVAAVDGVESARAQHLAHIASGRASMPRVVQRGYLDCRNVADAELLRND